MVRSPPSTIWRTWTSSTRSSEKTLAAALSETADLRRRLPPFRLAIPAVSAAWAVAFEIPHFISMVRTDPANTDFRLFYVAAQAGLRWGWPHMYDPDRLQQLSSTFVPSDGAIASYYTYLNPPLVAWLVTPLTALPITSALYIWTAINIAFLVAAWWLAGPGTGFARFTVLLVSLAVWPTVLSLERGQPVLITYALAIGCWWMAGRRREVEAGVLLALAWAIKPQDVALLPAVLLLCGFYRAAAYWLVTTVAVWAVFALILGPTGMGTYLAVMAWASSDPSYTATPLLGPFGAQTSLLLTQFVFGIGALAGVWRQRRSWRVAFAIGLVGTTVSSIHLHEYDLVALVVAAWLALGEPTSAVELAWLAIGVVCAQAPAIGIRLPILLWQPIWLAILSLRRTSIRSGERAPLPLLAPTPPRG